MILYNSLTRKKEKLYTISPDSVSIYSCGPTVYDRAHIGNLRAYIFADTLQRTLKYIEGYKVNWVINITDIDDKIINKLATEKKSSKKELKSLTNRYTQLFIQDLDKVGISTSDITNLPKATDYIENIQTTIIELINSGYAYISEGSVYFSIQSYIKAGNRYGLLSKISTKAKSRLIDDQDQKQGIGDFVLWKAAKPNEPTWDFIINNKTYPGRPGWHIECTVMSRDMLGQPFDIHTGGIDHIFPHHENEIAQAGGHLANFFLHNEFLQLDSNKMSKSLGNIIDIDKLEDPLAFRYLCLSTHYRKELKLSNNSLKESINSLSKIRDYASKVVYNTNTMKDLELNKYWSDFKNGITDDLNTSYSLSSLSALVKSGSLSCTALEILKKIDKVLGLKIVPHKKPFSATELKLLQERDSLRKKGDYNQSDVIRGRLQELAIKVEDLDSNQLAWRI